MCISTFLLPADPNLGPFDRKLLTDQTFMEMLFEGYDEGCPTGNHLRNTSLAFLHVTQILKIRNEIQLFDSQMEMRIIESLSAYMQKPNLNKCKARLYFLSKTNLFKIYVT